MKPVKAALKDAGLSTSDIDEVILVGGSTRIPKIQEEVEKFFGKKPSKHISYRAYAQKITLQKGNFRAGT